MAEGSPRLLQPLHLRLHMSMVEEGGIARMAAYLKVATMLSRPVDWTAAVG